MKQQTQPPTVNTKKIRSETPLITQNHKRIKILSKLLGKEIKYWKKNIGHNNMVATDLKSKIYELAYLRQQILSVMSETKKESQNDMKVKKD